MCIFAVSVACTEKVSWAPTHAGVFIPQVFWTSTYISATQSLHVAHMCSCMHSLFIVDWGWWLRGSTSLCGALVAWPGGLFWAAAEIKVLSCVSCFWCRGGWECTLVYVYVHTHTLHMGCLMWAQGSWRDTWRARRIPMERILANMFSYVCTKFTCPKRNSPRFCGKLQLS